ncbi:MAG: translocation/assembly module TamB [Ferruginibacter sp.]|nr:translocation/assembly module TamB [Cytophagales bacterium]
MQGIKKTALRVLLFALLLTGLLVGGAVIALRIPALQTRAVQYAAKELTARLHFPIEVEAVRIRWFSTLTLRGVRIRDRAARPMIEVGELDVNFALSSLLDTATIRVDEATLRNASVRLAVDARTGDLNLDDFLAAINEATASGKTTATGRSPAFGIHRVNLENVRFSYDDPREDSLDRNRFDYYHFTLDSLYTSASDFRIAADTIALSVSKLRATERLSRLRIHELSTRFRYTKRDLTFDRLFARIGQSTLRNRLVMRYPNGTRDFSQFNDRIRLEAHLDSAVVNARDLALFAPDLRAYDETWRVSGDFKGRVSGFKVKGMDFSFGRSSRLRGDVGFDGLPNVRETFVNLDLQPSVVDARDVRQYVDGAAYRTVEKFGRVRLKGKFVGFSRDFVANGAFQTDLGNLVSDINLKISNEKGKSSYQGKLTTVNFDLGKLIDEPRSIQKIDLSGQVAGRGLTLRDADLTVKANVVRLGYNGYDYRNVRVDGTLRRSLFTGQLAIRDPNLVFDLAGEVDLRQQRNYVDVRGRLEKADLKALKLSRENLSLQTDLNVRFQGFNLDEVVGEARFLRSTVVYNNRALRVDSLYLFASKEGPETPTATSPTLPVNRVFRLDSELLAVNARGRFEFTRAAADLGRLLREYELYFTRSETEQTRYYQQKRKNRRPAARYQIDYAFQFKNINPVVALFDSSGYVARNTRLEGVFTSGNTSIFSLNSQVDTLRYQKYRFYGTTVDLVTSKLADSASVLAQVVLSSEKQQLGGFAPTENVAVEGVWNRDRIDFTGRIRQSQSTNRADLKGDIRFVPDGVVLEFKPSRFLVLDNEWNLARDNSITVIGKQVTFDNVSLGNRGQVISLHGALSVDPTVPARLQVQDFNLATLGRLLGRDIGGVVNGYVTVRDAYNTPNLDSELSLDELVVDKFLVGNVAGEARWDEVDKRLRIDYRIERMNKEILLVRGLYDPNAGENEPSLDLLAQLKETDLEIVEPFAKPFVSQLSGTASGTVRIGGRLSAPLLKGELNLRKGRLKYNYLNTFFRFEDQVFLSENQIGTRQLRLVDEEGNLAILKGGLFHDGFRDFVLDFNATFDHFKLLDTDSRSGETYYGTAFATGNASLFGPIDKITIRADARSERGTRIYIPLDRKATVEQQRDYIQFVSKQRADTAQRKIVRQVNLSGIKLDFNLDITPDAACELIFDKRAGDLIKATGNGKIKLQIDTKGDFTMLGNYEIAAGSYNFTFLNVVNKQFNIKSDSRITWTGDPYSALLDIKAAYVQLASLYPILLQGTGDPTNPEQKRRYPAAVLLNLTGNLMSPEIDLGVEINEYPRVTPFTTAVPSFLSSLKSDEQELSRQVFSLMVLRQFSPKNEYASRGAIGNSVSELLSNQFSYWASQIDQNLEIDFNLGGLDQEALNNFQLRLSYAFLNGRLRLTRDGSFTNTRNEADAVSVLGEWTLEYWITPDGEFRLKVYNRNNQNQFSTGLSNANSTSTGFSLLHTQSFNRFGELIRPKPKKKATEIPLQEEKTAEDTSLPVGRQEEK